MLSMTGKLKNALLMDESLAIQVANELNIETFPTTTVLLMSLRKGLLEKDRALFLLNQLI